MSAAVLCLSPAERKRYVFVRNLIHFKSFCKTRGLNLTALGLELKGSTAVRDDRFDELDARLSRIVLMPEKDLTKGWKLYEDHASQCSQSTLQLILTPFDEDPAAVDEECESPVNNLFYHPVAAVRVYLKRLFDSKMDLLPDMEASLLLGRTVFHRNCSGYNYVFSSDPSVVRRPEVLRTLLECHRGRTALPLASTNPAHCPKSVETGIFCCLVTGSLKHTAVRIDGMGKCNGKSDKENRKCSAKTESFSYSLNADGTKLIPMGDEEYNLHMYKARYPSAPHIQKTVWTLAGPDADNRTHLLIWTFEEPKNLDWTFPHAAPHGNSRTKDMVYTKADCDLKNEAAKLLKDRNLTITSCQQLLMRKHGKTLSTNSLEHIARRMRGRTGTIRAGITATDPTAVAALRFAAFPGIQARSVEVYHSAAEKSTNLVVVDLRLLRIAASCQPSRDTLLKRKEGLERCMSTADRYLEFLEEARTKKHDDSGYWRATGGGWGVDTTFGLSDYYVTVIMAELPHVRTNDRKRSTYKRPWIPTAVYYHNRKDAETFARGFAVMNQLMAGEIDGIARCPAFLLSDKERALAGELKKVPLFQNAVHGNCDFHLLCNFQDSGFKKPKRKFRRDSFSESDSSAEEEEEDGGGDEEEDGEGEEDVNEDGEEPVAVRRLDRHYRTTSVLFGKSHKLPYTADDPGTFEPGALWARTYEIFLHDVKQKYKNGEMDKADYKYFVPRAKSIYDRHGAFFRLFTGRSTLLGTTNPIESFFKRMKQDIGHRKRTVDQLFKDVHEEFTKIYEDIKLAVTNGGISVGFRLSELPPGPLQLLEDREAQCLLKKYGLSSAGILRKNNFAHPLPEDMISVVVPKAERVAFVTNVEENWRVEYRATDRQMLLINKAKKDDLCLLDDDDGLLLCHKQQCKSRFCMHIAIALGLYPEGRDREEAVNRCMKRYFSDKAMHENATRPGAGEKGNRRKFSQKSKKNKALPLVGSMRRSLCDDPETQDAGAPKQSSKKSAARTLREASVTQVADAHDETLDSVLNDTSLDRSSSQELDRPNAGGSITGGFKVPSPSSVASNGSARSFLGADIGGRRSDRKRNTKRSYSPDPVAVKSRPPSVAGSQRSHGTSVRTLTEIDYYNDAFH